MGDSNELEVEGYVYKLNRYIVYPYQHLRSTGNRLNKGRIKSSYNTTQLNHDYPTSDWQHHQVYRILRRLHDDINNKWWWNYKHYTHVYKEKMEDTLGQVKGILTIWYTGKNKIHFTGPGGNLHHNERHPIW